MKVGAEMVNYYPRLKDLREDHDLSRQQTANELAMKQPQYSRYERTAGYTDRRADSGFKTVQNIY